MDKEIYYVINTILKNLPYVVLCVAAIMLYFPFRLQQRKLKYNVSPLSKINFSEISNNIRKNPISNILIGKLSDSLNELNSFHAFINDILAVMMEILYIFAIRYIYLQIVQYAQVFYTKFLAILISITIPLIIYNFIYSFIGNKLLPSLSDAFDEISAAFLSSMKREDSIKEATPYMNGHMQKIFNNFYHYIRSGSYAKGFTYIKSKIRSPYIEMFCNLYEYGQNSPPEDIAQQLHKLSVDVSDEIVNRQETLREYTALKFLFLFNILSLPKAMAYFTEIGMNNSVINLASKDYFYSIEGGRHIILCFCLAIGGYIVTHFFESIT